MIIFKKGNLFESECHTLVNTVNCDGVMGKGIALQFKQRYPEMFEQYKIACKGSYLNFGGNIWIYENLNFYEPIKILCFATKEHWWNPSKLEWIEKGLQQVESKYVSWDLQSIAWPKLGCNNGGLNWEDQVKPLMIKYLEPLKITNEIYE
jgi:O-acetyl-ADP-ribose deacetylase (regulator of RNase III)